VTEPGPVGDAAATAQAIVENAQRLGLTWTLRLATVVDGSSPGAVVATYDGDTAPIAMTSMIGTFVVGQRVYVIQVPPSGNFITGFTGGPSAGSAWVARQTLGASAASVTFSNIPTTLRSLQLRWRARSDTAALVTVVNLRIDSNAAVNYNTQNLQSNGAAATAAFISGTSGFVGHAAAATAIAGIFGTGIIDFNSWDLQTQPFLAWIYESGVMTSGGLAHTGSGSYSPAGPWTSIQLIPNAGSWIAGSDFQLLGVPS